MTTPRASPFDTWWSASLRVLVEAVAWVAGAWATGQWLGLWAALIALVVLIGAPAVFSTPGDKEKVIVEVPGVVRVLIEIDLSTVAVVAMWYLFGVVGGVFTLAIAIATQMVGWRRARWLLVGAPPV
jgi:hypothetical protein